MIKQLINKYKKKSGKNNNQVAKDLGISRQLLNYYLKENSRDNAINTYLKLKKLLEE